MKMNLSGDKMVKNHQLENAVHFIFEQIATGVFACIHKPGGAAFSNAGIIDLGDRTLVVDTCETLAAGYELRLAAETLFNRPVDTIILTHSHQDHWMGASCFASSTSFIASEVNQRICTEEMNEIVEDFKDPSWLEEEIRDARKKLALVQDERVKIGLENSILRRNYVLAEMAEYKPKYIDQTFEKEVAFQGSKRSAQVISLGRGHSQDDTIVILPEENLAFIGDIGFFDCQPFMGSCDLELYRQQLNFIQATNLKILVPGHGPVGNIEKDITAQLKYLDLMEDLVGKVAKAGGSIEEAMQISLPKPYDGWLNGGMSRFETNVRYLFGYFGRELTPDS